MTEHNEAATKAADYIAYTDRVWHGSESLLPHLSGAYSGDELVRLRARVGFFPAFANVTAFDTGDGVVLVDSGDFRTADRLHAAVRGFGAGPVRSVVYTHGHVDHVFGVFPFDKEARENGTELPEVVAHEAVPARFDRYIRTAGYNSWINRRQFGVPSLEWPTTYRYPDTVYRDRLTFRRGELTFELVHARGETDDHTYVWIPELKTLCTGDLFIWNTPNAGNPQKVQRYPEEWARALRAMQELGAELLLPGHGVPVMGTERVHRALDDTARLLESLCEQTRELMNAGHRLDAVIHGVKVPEELLSRPYLHPAYDEPEFVVRNLWRLWGGWYDQNPAHLKPAPEAAVAAEYARAAGGATHLAERARELLAQGDVRLASHLAETAALAAPTDIEVARVRAEVYAQRARKETSTMARGVFNWAAAESAAVAEGTDVTTELTRSPEGRRTAEGVISVGVVDDEDACC
ncbi:alkyl sulfatase dimerization domain-containing protein [Streptomyces sp. VRA16 Mangrove soil]|uniref:alkyl sulfatase dimerization domain-containing protein n=1 Tax=Streptomyces sp. VRA16 Mangrove soil TaxID=2817434 RepID=UPI001AA004F0|nr:alkyl sulfatase dimerization domain-containing protein [Streptomyces sp. VRA16 Mangrove soil]MBO1335842.1 MBL fold metallo-hydrolase [Streptomyces sp. VRA16 Mangrove soil]